MRLPAAVPLLGIAVAIAARAASGQPPAGATPNGVPNAAAPPAVVVRDVRVFDGGAAGSPKALDVQGVIVPGLAYAWGGVMFMPGARPMQAADLSSARAVRFWARGDGGTYRVMLFAASRGRQPLTRSFVAGPEWAEYVMPLVSFDGIDGHDVLGIAFAGGPAPGVYRFRIDGVRVE